MKNKLYFILLLGFSFAHSQSWQWGRRGGGAFNSFPETIKSLETDAQGNIYLTSPIDESIPTLDGLSFNTYGDRDNIIASYTCDGAFRWKTIIGGAGSSNGKRVMNMKVDGNGDVYVILRVVWADQLELPFHLDSTTSIPNSFIERKRMCIAKYSGTTGNLIWYKLPQPPGLTSTQYTQDSYFIDLDINANGTMHILALLKPGLYFNGQFNNTTSGLNNYILQVDSNGNFVSVSLPFQLSILSTGITQNGYTFKRNTVNGKFYIQTLALSSYNNIPIQDNEGKYILCYDANGVFQWARTTNYIPGHTEFISDLDIDNSGFIYTSGSGDNGTTFGTYTITSPTETDVPFVLKLDMDGNVIWGTHASPAGEFGSQITYLHVNNNEVAVSPTFQGITWSGLGYPSEPTNNIDASLWRFNTSDGSIIASTKITSQNGANEFIEKITSDVYGNYIVGGKFETTINVNGTTLFSNGGFDFFIAKYGSNNCTLAVEE